MVDDVKRRVHGQIRHGGVRKSILRLKSERTGVKRGGGDKEEEHGGEEHLSAHRGIQKLC